MELGYGRVFNLMDTNGRRGDVINALNLYLNLLKEGYESDSKYEWTTFPKSLNQYFFYKRAVEESPDVFIEHPQFDCFQNKYKKEIELFASGYRKPLIEKITIQDRKLLDVAIESRARHYSSNLCKLGFITTDRKITPSGEMFLEKSLERDQFETILPLTNTNIALIRQLMKLRIFSTSTNGKRKYYSPFLFGVYLLLKYDNISSTDFRFLVQSTSPYVEKTPDELIEEYFKKTGYAPIIIDYPSDVLVASRMSSSTFEKYFKNTKSGKAVEAYWNFYNSLLDFKEMQTNKNYSKLITTLRNQKWSDKIKKAFGFGKPIFDFGEQNYISDIDFFLDLNKENELLSCSVSDFNQIMYKRFVESKYFDMSLEYSDTTKRMFGATGLFKFEKGIARLAFKELMAELFDENYLRNGIFGICSDDDYLIYEGNDCEMTYFSSVNSMSEIMQFDINKEEEIITTIEQKFGTSIDNVTELIRDKTSKDFAEHIEQKYPRDKVLELMKLFEDRNNDFAIKEYVNPEATVPTIYEYVTALAWYYLSDKKINVYDSLNLTLNADFEPVLHAGGGDGDIIVKEKNRVTMLEVTLMNKSSQGRGEMEPVLRHSTNLKAKYSGLDTMTFFIACELDTNTVNIWRYILTQEQIATLNSAVVSGIIIMSFTNSEICKFIERNITSDLIIEKTKESFVNGIPEPGWRDNIVNSLIS